MDISNKSAFLIAVFANLGGFALDTLGVEVAALPLLIFSVIGIVFVFIKNYLDSKTKKMKEQAESSPEKELVKNSDYFPRLNLNILKEFAKRVVNEYPSLPILKINLYRYHSKYFSNVNEKYAMVLKSIQLSKARLN